MRSRLIAPLRRGIGNARALRGRRWQKGDDSRPTRRNPVLDDSDRADGQIRDRDAYRKNGEPPQEEAHGNDCERVDRFHPASPYGIRLDAVFKARVQNNCRMRVVRLYKSVLKAVSSHLGPARRNRPQGPFGSRDWTRTRSSGCTPGRLLRSLPQWCVRLS